MAARPFVIPVTAVLRGGNPRTVEVAAPITDLFVSASAVPDGADVDVDVVLTPLGNTVQASGTVRAPWVGECRRCLQPARGEVRGEVLEVFEPHPVEDETYPLVHGEVDLEPLAREAVLLELPQAVLCREDCKGICPECGADRNEGNCTCEPPIDPRWAVLDKLRDS